MNLIILCIATALVVCYWLANSEPTYSCPMCNAHREDEHASWCSWKEKP